MKIDLKFIIAESKKFGLDLVSYTGAEFLYSEYERLKDWQNQGYAAGMSYMMRPAELICDPRRIFEKARSVLVFALHYDRRKQPDFKKGFGRVARYAWGMDYHLVIRERLKALMASISTTLGQEVGHRAFSDAVPLLERALGKKAGLGFVGKNSLLIRPKAGSYFFIAEILTDLEIVGAQLPVLEDNCGSCKSCMSNCPTGAIVSEHTVDAGRCISYMSIEKKGMLSHCELESLGEWVFGCDICQEVCPFNHTSLKLGQSPALDEFSYENGTGGLLDLSLVMSIRSNAEFKRVYSKSAFLRAGRESLIRNAAAVAANTAAECLVEPLYKAFSEDTSEVVRKSAFWSLSKLNHKCNIFSKGTMGSLINKALRENEGIKNEIEFY